LKDWNKSFKSVIDHKHHFDINVFNLFNERYTQAKKAIAEEGKIWVEKLITTVVG